MVWTADVDDGPPSARMVATPSTLLHRPGTRVGAFLDCVVELLSESAEPGLLIDSEGNVQWANEVFWHLPWVQREHGAAVFHAVLTEDSCDALMDALDALRADLTSRRVALRPSHVTDAPGIQVSLTSLARAGSDLVAARITDCATTRDLAARAWAMEAALLQIRNDLRALGQDDGDVTIAADAPSAPLPADLPARQRDVATLILQGRSIEDIATALDLSPHTVRNHLKVVFRRTGVHSRAAFVARYHA
jgi:DNA-binding NarL/FixJ family response regulator